MKDEIDWISPAQRIQSLPLHVFARLMNLKHGREQGLDLDDLGMGNPDGATPQPVAEAAIAKALQNPANHGYPPLEGTANFRRAIKQVGISAATVLTSMRIAEAHCH